MTPQEQDEINRLLSSDYTFRQFITKVTNNRYQFYNGFDPVIDALQEIADGTLHRLILCAHPRSGKSHLISELGCAYYLYKHPDRWAAISSYGATLSRSFSLQARLNYEASGATLGTKGVDEWTTVRRGGLWAVGADGGALGKGYHYGVIEDIFKSEKEAGSTLIRKRREDFLMGTFLGRAEPGASVIMSMHRWHKYDLLATVEELEDKAPEHWRIIDREAIKTAERKSYPVTYDVIEDTREEGEALVPERYPVEVLEKFKLRSPYFWAVQYQQNPVARGQVVYDKFNQNCLVAELHPGIKRYLYAIDFGAVNETVGIFEINQFGVYTLIDAFQLPDSITKTRAAYIQKKAPKRMTKGHGGAASETQLRREYRSHGLFMPDPIVTDVDVQISRTNEWLEAGKLKIYTGFENYADVVSMFDDCIRDDMGNIIDQSIWHYLDMCRYLASGEYGKGSNMPVKIATDRFSQ